MKNYQEKSGTLKGGPTPGTMAQGIALQRFSESRLPEDERICYDPYAVHFIDPGMLEWAKTHPQEAKALAEEWEQKMPGWGNAIRARVRYFDDFIQKASGEGFSQLIILGAGYDTRAYRMGELKGTMRVFEVDNPHTLNTKTGIITGIFGMLPDHVAFIPLDLEKEDLWSTLKLSGYSPAAKSLFVMEGLVMYLHREAVVRLFSGIFRNSGPGSTLLFDFIPQSLADGTSDREGGKNIHAYTVIIGEPLRSGFSDSEVEPFMARLGFSGMKIILPDEYKKMYFTGKNAGRTVSGLLSFASAIVPDPSQIPGKGAKP